MRTDEERAWLVSVDGIRAVKAAVYELRGEGVQEFEITDILCAERALRRRAEKRIEQMIAFEQNGRRF